MADINNVGTVIACVAATPATVDASGFAALTWTATIGELSMWDSGGDTSIDITNDRISGRTTHMNGGVDGGECKFTYAYELTDAGQVILRANNNGATTVSFRETHTDGKIVYFYGKVANITYTAIANNTSKGQSGIVRINSPKIVV